MGGIESKLEGDSNFNLKDLPFTWNGTQEQEAPGDNIDGYKDDKYYLALDGETASDSRTKHFLDITPQIMEKAQSSDDPLGMKQGVVVAKWAYAPPPMDEDTYRTKNAKYGINPRKGLHSAETVFQKPPEKCRWNQYQIGPPGYFEDGLNVMKHTASALNRAMIEANLAQKFLDKAVSTADDALHLWDGINQPPEYSGMYGPNLEFDLPHDYARAWSMPTTFS